MKYLLPVIILILYYSPTLRANLEVALTSTESTANKSLVKFKAKNTFSQGIQGARAWVFLMDNEGKVVGQKAQWVIGGKKEKDSLEIDNESEYSVVVDTKSKPTQTKITFSKLILADGSSVNPQKHVVKLEE